MRALSFWKSVTMDRAGFLEEFVSLLSDNGIQYCVVGGQAVNAYAEPLVSLDLDIAVALGHLAWLDSLLEKRFRVEKNPHSWNVSVSDSDLRVQIQIDPRYFPFPARATEREVLGVRLPVASVEDVLQGKIWAATDPERRPSKRRKDLLDIERLLERHPELRPRLPAEVLKKLETN